MHVAYFENIRSQIISLLREAKNEISIAMAWFTSMELFNELRACLLRSVRVKLVLLDNPINFMDYAPDFNEFIKAGGFLYIAHSDIGFMHHKFCIIDKKTVLSGSYNWTYYAENRNVENVYVTDNEYLVKSYQCEFDRLTNLIGRNASESPRYSILDIDELDGLNTDAMNYEIENICHALNLPTKRLVETKTQVVICETKLTPISKYEIGIVVEGEEEHKVTFIDSGSKLPIKSDMITLYFNSAEEKECPCKIVRNNPDGSDCNLIKEEDLFRISESTCNLNLKIDITMYLEDNGSLRVDVNCSESGKKMTISKLDKDLVKYV